MRPLCWRGSSCKIVIALVPGLTGFLLGGSGVMSSLLRGLKKEVILELVLTVNVVVCYGKRKPAL